MNYNQICFEDLLEIVMKLKSIKIILVVTILVCLLTISYTINPPNLVQAQQPTGSIPTVTPLTTGPQASVKAGYGESVKVRSGPGTTYDQVGVILTGETVNIIGKTMAGDWLLIEYFGVSGSEGWVWSAYMNITGGEIPVVEIPPTPTPKVTNTIDPTMAAQFVITPESTRMPTFTAAAPVTIPTYSEGNIGSGKVPVGLVILILAGLGVLVGMISFVQSR